MTCDNKLSKNFARKCGHKPKSGLDNVVYFMNTSDIDKAVSQLNASKTTVTTLALIALAKMYKAEGAGKYPQGNTELVKSENIDGWKHGNTFRFTYYGEDEREQLQKMIDNGRITTLVKKKDTGLAGELSYDFLGWESGMEIASVVWASNENDGVVTVTLGTAEGEEEGTDRKIYLDTDLATTEAFILANTYVPA